MSPAAGPQARPGVASAGETLRLDPIACAGHGLCAELFPERIWLDDWGYPVIDADEITPAMLEHARRAVSACPAVALRLERAAQAAARR